MDKSYILLLFMLKHFIVDFPMQAHPYMYKNKGTYGHPGGILHAHLHMIGTWCLLKLVSTPQIALPLAIADGVIHYHIDYAKMKLGARFNLKPDNSEWFWILLGFDQLLHFLTYYWFITLL